jgi:hypothetical protein
VIFICVGVSVLRQYTVHSAEAGGDTLIYIPDGLSVCLGYTPAFMEAGIQTVGEFCFLLSVGEPVGS